jgi:hypothetical protein
MITDGIRQLKEIPNSKRLATQIDGRKAYLVTGANFVGVYFPIAEDSIDPNGPGEFNKLTLTIELKSEAPEVAENIVRSINWN